MIMVLGVLLLCVLAFPWYTWLSWKEDSYISSRFIFIVIGSLALIIPGTMINLNLQNAYDEGYYFHQEQQHILYNYRYTNNLSLMGQYRDSSSYPLMGKLHSKTTGLLILIGNIQTKMVEEAEGKPGMPAASPVQISQTERGPEIQYKLLLRPFHPGPVRDFLFPGCSSRKELNKALAEYTNYLSGLSSAGNLQKYKGLLEPSVYLPGDIPESGGISLLSGLHSLELLKNSILTVESYMLKTIADNK